MLQGRAGGGARFNLGEASVSRASCRIDGRLGHGWALGSNGEHAELIAQADALLQDPAARTTAGAMDRALARRARRAPRTGGARSRRQQGGVLHPGQGNEMNEMRAAFADPVHDSQRCFRATLAALAEPATADAAGAAGRTAGPDAGHRRPALHLAGSGRQRLGRRRRTPWPACAFIPACAWPPRRNRPTSWCCRWARRCRRWPRSRPARPNTPTAPPPCCWKPPASTPSRWKPAAGFRRAAPLRHGRRAGRFLAAVAGQSRPFSAGRGHLADQRRARGRPAAQHPRQGGLICM